MRIYAKKAQKRLLAHEEPFQITAANRAADFFVDGHAYA